MKTKLATILLALSTVPSPGCGGGGGGDATSPSHVVFPTSGAMTDAPSITVSGRTAGGAARVVVENMAAVSTDGYVTWTATVPLGVGTNRLLVEVLDADGAPLHDPFEHVIVRRSHLLQRLDSIAVDTNRDVGWLLEDQESLYAFDLTTGDLQYVSGDQRGSGPPFPRAIQVAPEPGGSVVYVLDAATKGLFAVDVDTGDRTQLVLTGDSLGESVRALVFDPVTELLLVVSNRGAYAVDPIALTSKQIIADGDTSKGPALGSMQALAVDAEALDVYVVSETEVQRIDPVTGAHESFTSAFKGTGQIVELLGVTVDSKRGLLYVFDNFQRLLYEIDPTDGSLKILTQLADGASATRIAYDDVNDRVLICEHDTDTVLAYDIQSTQLVNLVSHRLGSGRAFGLLGEIVVEDGRWFAADFGNYSVVEIDPNTGNRSLITGGTRGLGDPFDAVDGIALDLPRNRAFVCASSDEAIVDVDLATGDRTKIVEAVPGPGFDYPLDAVRLSDGRLLFLNGSPDGLFLLDLDGPMVIPFSVDGDGNGAPFIGNPWSIHLDEANDRALVSMWSSSEGGRILAVDLATGVRTIVADDKTVGSGEELLDPTGMALDTETKVLYVALGNASRILAIDLTTGVRTVHTGAGAGTGPLISFPRGLALDRDGGQLLAFNHFDHMLIGVSLATGDRVILSK